MFFARNLLRSRFHSAPRSHSAPISKPDVVRAFKKTICHEMGKSGSSLYAIQTLPLAADVARALNFDIVEFLVSCGFSSSLLKERGYGGKNEQNLLPE